jgi:hypothetical protein
MCLQAETPLTKFRIGNRIGRTVRALHLNSRIYAFGETGEFRYACRLAGIIIHALSS